MSMVPRGKYKPGESRSAGQKAAFAIGTAVYAVGRPVGTVKEATHKGNPKKWWYRVESTGNDGQVSIKEYGQAELSSADDGE